MCATAALLAVSFPTETSAQNKPANSTAIEVITLGTGGGPILRKDRAQTSNALIAGDSIFLIDVGEGVLQRLAQANVDLRAVRGIFLTHLHVDHIGSLGAIIAIRWHLGIFSRLRIYGPPGTKTLVAGLVEANAPVIAVTQAPERGTAPKLKDTIEVIEVAPPRSGGEIQVPNVATFDRVRAVQNSHLDYLPPDRGASLSYRFERNGKSVVFTGDTGPSKSVERLASNADLMVGELVNIEALASQFSKVTNLPQSRRDVMLEGLRRYHLTPQSLGDMASNARVKRLVASHIIPGADGEDENSSLNAISKYYLGNTVIAHDLDKFFLR